MTGLRANQERFRDEAMALAKQVAPAYGLDWRMMTAQAILESGWGESMLAREAKNFFGITAVPETPAAKTYVLQTSTGPLRFQRYASMEESFHAYGNLLATSRYYAGAREAKDDVGKAFQPIFDLMRRAQMQSFLQQMAPVYCPDDPDYQTKVMQIVDMIE